MHHNPGGPKSGTGKQITNVSLCNCDDADLKNTSKFTNHWFQRRSSEFSSPCAVETTPFLLANYCPFSKSERLKVTL